MSPIKVPRIRRDQIPQRGGAINIMSGLSKKLHRLGDSHLFAAIYRGRGQLKVELHNFQEAPSGECLVTKYSPYGAVRAR